jgi:alkylation response protein AidB-like acyl-CoA dehydrogenase
MSFSSTPLFAGDLFDTALRVAQEDVLKASQTQEGVSSDNWRQMLNLGWQGVIVSEDDGGVGASVQDLSAIVEAVARQGNVAPLVDRCAVAPVLLSAAKENAEAAKLLHKLMTGEVSVCTALDAGEKGPGLVTAPWVGADLSMQGHLLGIDLSEPATHVLFRARNVMSQESMLVLLDWNDISNRVNQFTGTDGRQYADINLSGLSISSDSVLLKGADAAQAVSQARQMGALLSCVQTVGAAAAMIELTIEYLNTRQQFGVALSSFQALRHRTVEMYVAYENARGLVLNQIEHIDAHGLSEDPYKMTLIKLYVAGLARLVSESSIQLHGGMGMSWETLVARLAMQATSGSLQYGGPSECLDWLTAQTLTEST